MENKFYDIMNNAKQMSDDEFKNVVDSLSVMFKDRRFKRAKEAKQRVIDAIKAYQTDFPDCPFYIEEAGYDISIHLLDVDKVVL